MPDMLYSDNRFTIGRVISRTFGVIRQNFGTVALLSLVAYGLAIPISLAVAYITTLPLQPGALNLWLNSVVALSRASLAGIIPYAFLAGGITHLAFNDGETRPSLGQAFRNAFGFLLPLMLVDCIVALALSVGYVLLIVPAIFVMVIWFVALPVRVIEGPGWRNALSRSAALTKGHRWELFALLIVFFLAIVVASIPLGVLSFMRPELITGGFVSWLTPLSWITTSVIGALDMVGRAVTYTELRRSTTGGLPTQVASVFE